MLLSVDMRDELIAIIGGHERRAQYYCAGKLLIEVSLNFPDNILPQKVFLSKNGTGLLFV